MVNEWIRRAVRLRFKWTAHAHATRHIERALAGYLQLADQLDELSGGESVRVPPMPGVDEDMREWSFYMILEHNTIVNRAMQAIVTGLAAGCVPETKIENPKMDVMPSACPGPEQVDLFSASVTDYVQAVAPLTHLRQTATYPHPIFGLLTAHGWHCMCGFHLQLHLRQARVVSKQ